MTRNGGPCVKRLHLEGKEFNGIKVIRFSHVEKGNTRWECLCHCGKKFITTGSSIKGGLSKSCGCLRIKNFKRTPLDKGLASFNQLYNSYIYKAKDRGLVFNLSKDFFKNITKQKCFYCGLEPRQTSIVNNKIKNEIYLYNGIDRIDNSVGYIENNCVPCCKYCNMMKLDMKLDDFLNKVSLIYERLVIGVDN